MKDESFMVQRLVPDWNVFVNCYEAMTQEQGEKILKWYVEKNPAIKYRLVKRTIEIVVVV